MVSVFAEVSSYTSQSLLYLNTVEDQPKARRRRDPDRYKAVMFACFITLGYLSLLPMKKLPNTPKLYKLLFNIQYVVVMDK